MNNESRKRISKSCVIQCAWEDCHSTVTLQPSEYQTFSDHLKVHADEFVLRVKNEMDGDDDKTVGCCCMWRDCTWEGCEDLSDLIRHIMFHGYHALLKALGQLVQKKLNLNECTIEVDDHYHMLSCVTSPFICFWQDCNTEFLCPDKYYRHVESHVGNSVGYYDDSNQLRMACQWKECSNLFRDKHKLKEHVRVHTHEKLFACPGCGGLFSNRTKLLDHLSRQNVAAYENFQCSHCLKRCASERLLRDHMRHHVNYLKCPHCDMTCPNPGSLKYHIHYRHSDDRPFSCSMCDHSFKSNSDLIRHEESHLQKSYVCNEPGCDYSTKTAHCLRRHVKIAHTVGGTKRYICHVCNHAYSRGFGLTKHLKKQHNFSWPSGHPRFRYIEYDDGLFRLQMVRFESVELTKRLQRDGAEKVQDYEDEEIIQSENNGDFSALNEAVDALEMKYGESHIIVDAAKIKMSGDVEVTEDDGTDKVDGDVEMTEDDGTDKVDDDVEIAEEDDVEIAEDDDVEIAKDDGITKVDEIADNVLNNKKNFLFKITDIDTLRIKIGDDIKSVDNEASTKMDRDNKVFEFDEVSEIECQDKITENDSIEDTVEKENRKTSVNTLDTSEETILLEVNDGVENETDTSNKDKVVVYSAQNEPVPCNVETRIDADSFAGHEFGLYLQPKPAGYNTDIMSQITALAKPKSKKRTSTFVDNLYKQLVKTTKLKKPTASFTETTKRRKRQKLDPPPCVQLVEVTVDGSETSEKDDDINEETIDSLKTGLKPTDNDQMSDKSDGSTEVSSPIDSLNDGLQSTTDPSGKATYTTCKSIANSLQSESVTTSVTMHISTCTLSGQSSTVSSSYAKGVVTSLLNSPVSRDQHTQTTHVSTATRKTADDDDTNFDEKTSEDVEVNSGIDICSSTLDAKYDKAKNCKIEEVKSKVGLSSEDASLSTFVSKLDQEMGERLDVSEALLSLKSL